MPRLRTKLKTARVNSLCAMLAIGKKKRFTHSSDCLPLRCAAVDPRYSHLRFLIDSLRREICQELEDKISNLCIDRTDEAKEPPSKKNKYGESAMCFLLSGAWLRS